MLIMKKWSIFLVSLLVILTITLAGCSDSPEETPPETAPEEEPTDEAEAVETETTEDGMQRFESVDLGFAISYPEDWIYEVDGHIVIFSGQEGTEAYDTTLNLQTLQWGIAYESFHDFYEDYKGQVEGAGGRISDLAQEDYVQDGENFDGAGFVAEYTQDGTVFRQFIVAVDRGDGYFHQLSYTAPEHLYEKYEDTAIQIMDTLNLLGLDS